MKNNDNEEGGKDETSFMLSFPQNSGRGRCKEQNVRLKGWKEGEGLGDVFLSYG